jgi:hypothetical protein
VLHVLLERVQPDGWEIGGARDWKGIRKYRAGAARHADTHNVLGVAKDAKDAGCEVLAFSRDLDRDTARKQAIEDGIARVPEVLAGAPAVIGGVAVPTLEGWILALLGVGASEALSPRRAEEALVQKGVARKDGAAMVRVVEDADLAGIPADATSLRVWLGRAAAVLPPLVADRASR